MQIFDVYIGLGELSPVYMLGQQFLERSSRLIKVYYAHLTFNLRAKASGVN